MTTLLPRHLAVLLYLVTRLLIGLPMYVRVVWIVFWQALAPFLLMVYLFYLLLVEMGAT